MNLLQMAIRGRARIPSPRRGEDGRGASFSKSLDSCPHPNPPPAGEGASRRAPACRNGFSLIELAAVVAILAVISGTLLSVTASRRENTNLETLKTRLDTIEAALKRHVNVFGSLPCPASRSAAEDTSGFGAATSGCDSTAAEPAGTFDYEPALDNDDVRLGVVPTRTLGLPDRYMYDEWGGRITYAVVKKLANGSASDFEAYTSTDTSGVVLIQDKNTNPIPQVEGPDASGNYNPVIAYALVSHGKDRKGAYNRRGLQPVACGVAAGGEDAENCNDDDTFVDSEINDSTTAANYYYDKIRWKKWSDLVDDSCNPATAVAPEWCATTTPCANTTTSGTIATGGNSAQGNSCMIFGNVAYCWGGDGDGELGNGAAGSSTVPTAVNTATGLVNPVSYINGGIDNFCAVQNSSAVYCWGADNTYAIGDNNGSTATQTSPAQTRNVANTGQLTGVSQVASAGGLGCAMKSDGTEVYCWGRREAGATGTVIGASFAAGPEIVRDNTGVALTKLGSTGATNFSVLQIAVGGQGGAGSFACARLADGSAWCWGDNSGAGKLGNNSAVDSAAPVQVRGVGNVGTLANVRKIALGGDGIGHACAVVDNDADDTNGTASQKAVCWGDGGNGKLGNGGTANSMFPVNVLNEATADVADISAGEQFTCALIDADATCGNEVYCWGFGTTGQLGNGASASSNTPVQVINSQTGVGLTNIVDIASGGMHTCAYMDSDADNVGDQVWCWGKNTQGELGDNTTTSPRNSAVRVCTPDYHGGPSACP